MRKSAPQPAIMRTPTGGRKRVIMTIRIAGAESDIVRFVFSWLIWCLRG